MKYDFACLGENIAYLRRTTGLTQEMLAYRLGVTSQAVSKWERQLSCPDVSLLPVMAEVFDVRIDELFVCLDPEADENRIDALPWEDDGRVRLAVFEGKRICMREIYECPNGEEMVLLVRHEKGLHAHPYGASGAEGRRSARMTVAGQRIERSGTDVFLGDKSPVERHCPERGGEDERSVKMPPE